MARFVFIDRDATTAAELRRPNTSINPRYLVWDSSTKETVDTSTSARAARDTVRDLNKTESTKENDMAKKTTTKTTPNRAELRKAYMFIVNNWAVSTDDVARHLKGTRKDADALLRRLVKAKLIEGMHVNNERELTWQSYYDIENSDAKETRNAASGDFTSAFPLSAEIAADERKRGGATGPRYTPEQIAKAIKLRESSDHAMPWKKIAAEVGVKSPAYFSKVVQAEAERIAKDAKKAIKKGTGRKATGRKSSKSSKSSRGPKAVSELMRLG